jgi:hypothetical protein
LQATLRCHQYRLKGYLMKPHRTAALVVLSWYLMVPPLSGPSGVATQAPLTQWTMGASFSSDQECEQARLKMLRVPGNSSNLDVQHLLAIQDSQCVSSESLPQDFELGPSPTPTP